LFLRPWAHTRFVLMANRQEKSARQSKLLYEQNPDKSESVVCPKTNNAIGSKEIGQIAHERKKHSKLFLEHLLRIDIRAPFDLDDQRWLS
jgi:hypothetical protein